MTTLRAWVMQHVGFVVCFTALCALFVAPLHVPRYLPFVDHARHVAELFVLAHRDEPAFHFHDYYDFSAWLQPYTAHRLLLLPLAHLVGAEAAYRLYLSLYVVGVALAVLLLCIRTGRPAWMALLCFPFIYGYPLIFGFTTYCAATAALLLAYVFLESWLAEPSRGRLFAFAASALLVFLLHPQPFGYLVVTAPVLAVSYGVTHGGPWQRLPATLAAMSAPAGLMLLWAIRDLAPRTSSDASFQALGVKVLALPLYSGLVWKNAGFWLVVIAWIVFALVVILSPRAVSGDRTWRHALWERRYLAVMGVLLCGAAVLPEVYRFQHYVASRLIPMAWLLIPVAIAPRPIFRNTVAAIALVGMSAALAVSLLVNMARFDREAASFDAVVEAVPIGARYRCHIEDPSTAVHVMRAYDAFCGHVTVEKGGLNGSWFAHIGIDFKDPWKVDDPGDPDLRIHGDKYDFYVVRAAAATTFFDVGGPFGDAFERRVASGPWRLYERVKPITH